MKVIVVGAGLGGLALAWALGRSGVDVVVLDQASALSEAGAGVQLSPNAMHALAFLGCDEAVAAVGFAPQAVEMRASKTARLLLRTDLGEAARRRWGAPYVQAHRSDLHAILLEGALQSGRVKLQLASGVSGLAPQGVVLRSGDRLSADAVVGCDGVRSAVRDALWGERPPRFLGQVAWRGTVLANRLPPGVDGQITQVWAGPQRHFVFYPVRGGALINFVAVTEQSDWRVESWSEPGDKQSLLEAFDDWPSSVRTVIDHAESVWRWALFDRPPLDRWSKADTTLLGDAAHPMAPFLAQGAAMALEDAVILARCLTRAGAVSPAFGRYEALRRARTAKVQTWSKRNGTLFHLPAPLSQGLFGAAALQDKLRGGGGAARFDWLYGLDVGDISV